MRAYNNSDASADWGGQRLQRRIRKPPALGAYDAIVAGGGVGGCAAAVKLAREGARVALLESSGVLGWEIVRARQTRIDLPGLSEQSQAAAQLAERIAARNGCFGDTVDPVATALAIDDWIIGAGVEPLLHTWPSSLALDELNRVTGCAVVSKSGYMQAHTGIVIDASWEAKLARSVFGAEAMEEAIPPSYTMLWNETDIADPLSRQVELECGCTCQVKVSPTYWPKEAQAVVTFYPKRPDQLDRDALMDLFLFELVEKMRGTFPELAEGIVSYVSDRSWQRPSFVVHSGTSSLANTELADGLFLAGPWLKQHQLRTDSPQLAIAQLLLLGETAAQAAIKHMTERNTRRSTYAHP